MDNTTALESETDAAMRLSALRENIEKRGKNRSEGSLSCLTIFVVIIMLMDTMRMVLNGMGKKNLDYFHPHR
jgi:hypothetical protein